MTETSSTDKTQITPDGERDLVMTRVFEAPPSLVFRAWTEPEMIKQWWGPAEWPTVHCTVDLRVGGKWHYCMRGPDGAESWGAAVYKAIERPNRLVFEDHFSDAEGTLNPPPIGNAMQFEELPGNRTRLIGRTTFASREHREELSAMGMVEGMTIGAEQLAALLARETGLAP